MSLQKIKFRDWEFEIDCDLTKKSYEMKLFGSADHCPCRYCKNYLVQRSLIFTEEIKKLLNDLGIEISKEDDVTEYVKLENGLHKYIGEFVFAGKIFSGNKFDRNGASGIQFTKISDNFLIAFGEKKDSVWSAIMFETNIPWVIEEPEEGNL
ncbi:MAG: hypothetical protein ABI686_01780 [Acidobacteriota bacterium]